MAKPTAKKPTPVEKKLVSVADTVISAAGRSRDPALSIPVRSLANINFNEKRGIIEMGKRKQERTLFNVGMARKFMQTVLVADALAELQRANLTTSLREIYYRTKHTMKDSHENTFDGQNESDPLIEDLEVTLTALREELHVRAENAGSIVGPVVLTDDGDRVDCARLGKGGYSVPSIVEPEFIQIRRCTADFVLLVEKGTQWNRLSEDKFWRRYNCVLLTGNGQPPRGVRRLARRLHEEYKIPVYVLVDNDPWGYYIYSVVKQGSINLAFESQRMAIPKAKFIGLSSADPDHYGLPRNVGIKLNDKDIGRAKELLKYRWFQKKDWQEEIKRMLASGLKYELDALANKDFRYLTKTYLPRKLKEQVRRRPGLGPAGVALPRRPGRRVRHRRGGGQGAGRLVRRDQAAVHRQGQVEVRAQWEHRPADELQAGLVRRGRGQEFPGHLGRIPGSRHQAEGQGPSVRYVHGAWLRGQLLLALPPAVVLRRDGHGQGRQEGRARHQRDREGRGVRQEALQGSLHRGLHRVAGSAQQQGLPDRPDLLHQQPLQHHGLGQARPSGNGEGDRTRPQSQGAHRPALPLARAGDARRVCP